MHIRSPGSLQTVHAATVFQAGLHRHISEMPTVGRAQFSGFDPWLWENFCRDIFRYSALEIAHKKAEAARYGLGAQRWDVRLRQKAFREWAAEQATVGAGAVHAVAKKVVTPVVSQPALQPTTEMAERRSLWAGRWKEGMVDHYSLLQRMRQALLV